MVQSELEPAQTLCLTIPIKEFTKREIIKAMENKVIKCQKITQIKYNSTI